MLSVALLADVRFLDDTQENSVPSATKYTVFCQFSSFKGQKVPEIGHVDRGSSSELQERYRAISIESRLPSVQPSGRTHK